MTFIKFGADIPYNSASMSGNSLSMVRHCWFTDAQTSIHAVGSTAPTYMDNTFFQSHDAPNPTSVAMDLNSDTSPDSFAGFVRYNNFLGPFKVGIKLHYIAADISHNGFNGPETNVLQELWTSKANTVNSGANTVVTRTSGNVFRTIWVTNGWYTQLNGTYRQILSVASADQMTVAGNAGTLTGAEIAINTTGQLRIYNNTFDSGQNCCGTIITNTQAVVVSGLGLFYNIQISGNRVSNWFASTAFDAFKISAAQASEIVISDNDLGSAPVGSDSYGIRLDDALDATVTGNRVIGYKHPIHASKASSIFADYFIASNNINCNSTSAGNTAIDILADRAAAQSNRIRNCDKGVSTSSGATYQAWGNSFFTTSNWYSLGSTSGTVSDRNGMAYTALNALAPGNGSDIYCTDCKVASASDNTCAGSGTGALAVRLNGAWRCFQSQN